MYSPPLLGKIVTPSRSLWQYIDTVQRQHFKYVVQYSVQYQYYQIDIYIGSFLVRSIHQDQYEGPDTLKVN